MKNIRKLAGISILLVLVFMIIALFQFQQEDEISALPEKIEYYFNQDWIVCSFENREVSAEEQKDWGRMEELIQKKLAEGNYREVDFPYEGKSNAGDIVVFKNKLPKEYAGLTLVFSSENSAVRVSLDGRVIYQSGFEENKEPKEPEKNENYVDIPKVVQEGELWIEMISSQSNAASSIREVKIETRDMVVIGVVGNSITDIGCCLLIVIMAILMFVLALIRHYTHQPARGEFFLGLTGLAAGFYCFIETDTLNIFYDVQEVYEMQEYLVLLIPLFLTMYFEKNFHEVYSHRFSLLLFGVIANAAIQIFLQIMNVRKMEDMMNISAAAIGIICVTAIVSLVQFDYQSRRYRTALSILAVIALLTGGIANVIINALLGYNRSNRAGQYSMMIFSIMMAVVHVLQISKEYRAAAEESASLLEEKVKAAKQQNLQLAQAKQEADTARQEALAANEAKGKFLAHMSHEIRTPINAVLGMDEMILRESKEENIRTYAMDIHMAGQTLLSLINDILDFSKIESGKMEIVPVEYDVSSLIHDLANMASQRAANKNIKFEAEVDHGIPSRLFGDDVRIRQVLTNILTNAVKYTHEGTVWMRVQSCREGEMTVLKFEVEDTGIGIREEDLPKLSAEFERIEEDRNRNIEGSGLGMNITIQLLALLGSKLQVESVYGEGSKFYFELKQKVVDDTPIGDFESRVHQIAENYHYSSKFCAPDAGILVVDDNAVNRRVLRNLLKETKIQVTDADGGAECLRLVQENHYDLIFLDHMMPEMDGVETLHHIKELSDYPCQNTPIVVLTANAVSGAKEKYLAEGFDDFLSKPIVPEKLETMIKKMLPEELVQEAAEDSGTDSGSQAERGTEENLEELPQVDGLDWNYAWLHLPDMELLEYTVKEFYAQIEGAADNLEQAYVQIEGAADNLEQIDADYLKPAYEQNVQLEWLEQYRIQVHAMKSLAATVGILPVSGLAKILEYAARDGKIEVITSLTAIFLEEWRSYRQKLQGVFGIAEEAKQEVTDHSIIRALVEMVRISMQEMDIDQADQMVRQLQTYEYPGEIEKNIRKLSEAVTNLNPEETEQFAHLLMEQLEG